jgi:hypothetical protein
VLQVTGLTLSNLGELDHTSDCGFIASMCQYLVFKMELNRVELREKNILVACQRYLKNENANKKKYRYIAIFFVFTALLIGVYIYINSEIYWKNDKLGLFLSALAGALFTGGVIALIQISHSSYYLRYFDAQAMSDRIEELGGADTARSSSNQFLRNLILWIIIAIVLLSIFNQSKL